MLQIQAKDTGEEHSVVEGTWERMVMAAEVGETLEKNKQIIVLKMRVGGIQWIYLGVLLYTSYVA